MYHLQLADRLDRYKITMHKDSQITNDPNDHCREVGNPRYILDPIKRIFAPVYQTAHTRKLALGGQLEKALQDNLPSTRIG